MNRTNNYNLKKPESSDYYNVEDFNDNADSIDNILKQKQDEIELETPEISITTNIGSLDDNYRIRKFGPLVYFAIQVRNASAVAAGEDVYKGVINTAELLPAGNTTAGGYISTHAIGAQIRPPHAATPGEIVVRNASDSAIAANQPIVVSFMYVCAEG